MSEPEPEPEPEPELESISQQKLVKLVQDTLEKYNIKQSLALSKPLLDIFKEQQPITICTPTVAPYVKSGDYVTIVNAIHFNSMGTNSPGVVCANLTDHPQDIVDYTRSIYRDTEGKVGIRMLTVIGQKEDETVEFVYTIIYCGFMGFKDYVKNPLIAIIYNYSTTSNYVKCLYNTCLLEVKTPKMIRYNSNTNQNTAESTKLDYVNLL